MKDFGLIELMLDCEQWPEGGFPNETFKMNVKVLHTYKQISSIFEREVNGNTFIYDVEYHGEGNRFTNERNSQNAVSEWDFIGKYYCENHRKKGTFRAKIISE